MKNTNCSGAGKGLLVVGVVLALALSAAALIISLKNCDELSSSDVTTNIETKSIGTRK